MGDTASSNNGSALRVFIVDDHPVIVDGLRRLFSNNGGIAVCGEASSIADARRRILALLPDVVILDLSLSDGSALELIREFSGDGARHVVVYSQFDSSEIRQEVAEHGATFLDKSASGSQLVSAVTRLGAVSPVTTPQ